jgi:hypothetical protein
LLRLAAILNLSLARENFARSRDESSFETASLEIMTDYGIVTNMKAGFWKVWFFC